MQARGVVRVVDRSAVIGSGPRQSSVGVLPVLGVAVLAEIEGIELIECLTSVDAELTECLVEGPLRAGGGVGGGHPNSVTTGFNQTSPPRHATTAWVPVPPKMSASRYATGPV